MIELRVELRMRIRLTLMSGFAADGWVIAPLQKAGQSAAANVN